jgi:Asp-tRNA(Asn)/Glu-tRNA(Gln) amidotransferase A subunit family amidase
VYDLISHKDREMEITTSSSFSDTMVPSRLPDRRTFLAWMSGMGVGGTLFPGVLWARLQQPVRPVTAAVISEAEKVAGLEFTDEERTMMVEGLNNNLRSYAALREMTIPNDVPPALLFDPQLPGRILPTGSGPVIPSRRPALTVPARFEELAFWPVSDLSELVRTRQVSATDLTELYLERLKRHGPTLHCVVSLTEERARDRAREADRELSAGRWRGPLHGIPWGAKDLLSVRGTRTTWGARPFEDQVLEDDASVVRRLDDAGAILVAKLTLGALAQGDVWFGGRTLNPWNLEQGSSGSSAGSASAVVAGLVGFAIGSETLGSIVSPATRCGATGLRPTFGRVSRAGAMALSWSMDKLGPLCRSVEDCVLVLDAIQGADGRDPTARDVPLAWRGGEGVEELRVGYLASAFQRDREGKEFDDAALEDLRRSGVEPIPFELPRDLPLNALRIILTAEAAAAFDELTRSGRDDLLVQQGQGAWPNGFRTARMIPAVEYIQANRVRTMVMGALEAAFDGFDVVVSPSFAPDLLLMTNLTGHPVVVLPSGFTSEGTPVSLSFVGGLWKDGEAAAVARRYQEATGFHRRRPSAFG